MEDKRLTHFLSSSLQVEEGFNPNSPFFTAVMQVMAYLAKAGVLTVCLKYLVVVKAEPLMDSGEG
uniref:Uncharacterized protein n=1 Tax=Vibrio splendidus TaxID=29497 RepID=A0A0H3ZZM0_VIBSP|nr:hypothetical protein [Vibrio splendidus]